jgi:type II secretory pathway pseudopilin PulG
MDEYQESNHNDQNSFAAMRAGANRLLVIAVVALLGIAAVTFAYGLHQQSLVRQLTAQTATANAAMNQMQGQLNSVTAKLNDLTAAQTSPQAPAASTQPADVAASGPPEDGSSKASEASATAKPVASAKPAPAKKHVAKRHTPVVDKKYEQLQAQLAEQQKELKDTQDEVAKNRADLEGTINSTRDDLNGSIAKTHDELVALEKRGERSYFEFDLSKAKQFQRVGPLTISLRKADTKHKSYDLAMIVDDNELQKKKVNLYEPILIHIENDSQPVQIVVNRIDKDIVHGYISAPKYKPSELATVGSASVTPVSTKPPANAANSQQPQQPQQ